MSNTFLTFQKFNDIESARAMADFLLEKGIAYEIDDERNYYDVSYSFNKFEFNIKLKIASADFKKANALMEEYYAHELNSVEDSYYLFQFSNAELTEIIQKPDEWGFFDYLLAKKILSHKQVDINYADDVKEKRIAELARPAKSSPILIVLGYVFAITFNLMFWFSPYWIAGALSIGATLAFLTKTLPNGKNVPFFNASTRTHGKIILLITIASGFFWIIYVGFWRYN